MQFDADSRIKKEEQLTGQQQALVIELKKQIESQKKAIKKFLYK